MGSKKLVVVKIIDFALYDMIMLKDNQMILPENNYKTKAFLETNNLDLKL
jgi:hypothetical protein